MDAPSVSPLLCSVRADRRESGGWRLRRVIAAPRAPPPASLNPKPAPSAAHDAGLAVAVVNHAAVIIRPVAIAGSARRRHQRPDRAACARRRSGRRRRRPPPRRRPCRRSAGATSRRRARRLSGQERRACAWETSESSVGVGSVVAHAAMAQRANAPARLTVPERCRSGTVHPARRRLQSRRGPESVRARARGRSSAQHLRRHRFMEGGGGGRELFQNPAHQRRRNPQHGRRRGRGGRGANRPDEQGRSAIPRRARRRKPATRRRRRARRRRPSPRNRHPSRLPLAEEDAAVVHQAGFGCEGQEAQRLAVKG